MTNQGKPKYQLRFFFDYHCGGCLWSGDESAYYEFGNGCLDSSIYDEEGKVIQAAKIELPISTKERVNKLDDLFLNSLNWDNPSGPSNWNQSQWDKFYVDARLLHKEIAELLGPDFEVLYEVEK